MNENNRLTDKDMKNHGYTDTQTDIILTDSQQTSQTRCMLVCLLWLYGWMIHDLEQWMPVRVNEQRLTNGWMLDQRSYPTLSTEYAPPAIPELHPPTSTWISHPSIHPLAHSTHPIPDIPQTSPPSIHATIDRYTYRQIYRQMKKEQWMDSIHSD